MDWSTYSTLVVESESKGQSWSLKHTLECDRNIKTYIRGNGSENSNLGLARSTELAARFCKYGAKYMHILKNGTFLSPHVSTLGQQLLHGEMGVSCESRGVC